REVDPFYVTETRPFDLITLYLHDALPSLRPSYADPHETFETDVMGTVNILEAIRNCTSVKAVVIVTSDKCYENNDWIWGYRENEDRKSTRLNSSHVKISYAVFCSKERKEI